jgi:hypothetical protein
MAPAPPTATPSPTPPQVVRRQWLGDQHQRRLRDTPAPRPHPNGTHVSGGRFLQPGAHVEGGNNNYDYVNANPANLVLMPDPDGCVVDIGSHWRKKIAYPLARSCKEIAGVLANHLGSWLDRQFH